MRKARLPADGLGHDDGLVSMVRVMDRSTAGNPVHFQCREAATIGHTQRSAPEDLDSVAGEGGALWVQNGRLLLARNMMALCGGFGSVG